jgi:Glycosyl hydrolase family 99
MTRVRRICLALLLALVPLVLLPLAPRSVSATPTAGRTSAAAVPLLAYYYIWYDTRSWDRAKDDYPELGRYSSDDPAVMARHVEMAKQAGIDGFIVSWKSTPTLNRRLEQLSGIATANGLKLALIYEGLDFHRNPLPVERVQRDLIEAADRYTSAAAFDIFDRPLVIWSGTWRFSAADIARVARPLRDRLLILGSERNPEGVRRLAGVVDGDAYYWSSGDPQRTPGYRQKLAAMGELVHDQGGIWIAPAAPGFDARKLGGSRVVERRDGATLLDSLNAAMTTAPDAIGLISWNEFSESSHVEPSQRYGRRYLDALTSLRREPGSGTAATTDFASDEPGGGDDNPWRLLLLGSLLLGGVGCAAVVVRRASRRKSAT